MTSDGCPQLTAAAGLSPGPGEQPQPRQLSSPCYIPCPAPRIHLGSLHVPASQNQPGPCPDIPSPSSWLSVSSGLLDGSQRARALSTVKEIILFLLSWGFMCLDADPSNGDWAQSCPRERCPAVPSCCAISVHYVCYVCYMGMCKEKNHRLFNSPATFWLKSPP